jgi:hypothetical protein
MRALLALLALVGAAHAQVCVTVNTDKDTLTPGDQKAAKLLVESAFQSLGVTTVPPPCSKLYTVANVRLGDAIVARIQGPDQAAQAKAASIGELDAVYDQLVRRLMGADSVTTRQNVTLSQSAPRRERADSIWAINIGSGYLSGADLDAVPVLLGFGYRYELDHVGIEAGGRLFLATGNSDDKDGGGGAGVRVMALYHFDSVASSSAYLGGGLGFGFMGAEFDGDTFSGGGLEGHVAVGYSFLRASTIRMYLQFDAMLPIYEMEETNFIDSEGLDPRYVPIFGFSLGVGWNRG